MTDEKCEACAKHPVSGYTHRDDSIAFVARPIRVKTRKGKDYSVLRVTIPKEVVSRLPLGPEDYLLVRARVAQWFHMLDWSRIPEVWQRLPPEVRVEIGGSGLPNPGELPAEP